MKRIILIFAFVAMWQSVFAYDFSAVAPSGQTLYYSIRSGGGVYVSYPGSFWSGYSKPTGDLTIPDSVTYGGTTYAVTSIGLEAFYNCSGLTSVTIPNSVISIGILAFENCSGLTTVHFNADSCTSAGGSYSNVTYRAFYGCNNITTFTFGNNVKIIPDYLCYDMDSLTSVTIPNSVTSIGHYAFSGCSGLTSLTIGSSVTSIKSKAFENCSGLTTVHFNADRCTDAGGSYNMAFYGCHNITTFTFGNNVKKIPSYLCYGMVRLTSVTIPNSVTAIGSSAFLSCSRLTTVHFNADRCTSAGGSYSSDRAFSGCHNITTFTFGSNVKIIPNYLCYGMVSLTSVTIPNSVTSIGSEAFGNCSGLTTVHFNADSCTYAGGSYYDRAFYNCPNITTFTFGNNVKIIPDYLCYDMDSLTSVTIPNSVISIGHINFRSCYSLTSIIVDSENGVYDSRNNCNAIIETATNTLLKGCRNTTIPNTVTHIGDFAFSGCSGLMSVTIPNSVTSIGERAFAGCSGLASLTIPNSVTSIGDYVFAGCSGLMSVTIPNSVTSIGEGAFYNCTGLMSVTIPNSVTSIGVFYNCSGLTSVTLGSGVDNIGDYTFAGCTHLRSIVSKATYPPICSNIAFEGVPSYCTLTVPCGSLPYYSVQSPWDTLFPLKQEDCRTEYTLIVESADPTMGYAVGGGTARNGDTVVICAVGNPGYRFLRWQDNNTDSVRTVTVTGNATYTAYFAETVGVEDVADGEGVRVWSYDGRIHVVGAEGMDVNVYDILGRRVNGKRKVERGKLELAVPAGVYLVRIGDLPARKVVVIKR